MQITEQEIENARKNPGIFKKEFIRNRDRTLDNLISKFDRKIELGIKKILILMDIVSAISILMCCINIEAKPFGLAMAFLNVIGILIVINSEIKGIYNITYIATHLVIWSMAFIINSFIGIYVSSLETLTLIKVSSITNTMILIIPIIYYTASNNIYCNIIDKKEEEFKDLWRKIFEF
jgi:hypothetical protein